MNSYQALQTTHIREAAIPRGPRYSACAPKLHAMVFTLMDAKGADVFALDRADVKALALEKAMEMKAAGKFGFIGMFITSAILSWVIGRLVDVVFDWLIARLREWIDRNKAVGSPFNMSLGRSAVFTDLREVFAEARAAL